MIIDVGGPEPPPIDEEAIWTRIAINRKKGRIYGKCVVPAYFVHLIIRDVDDNDTATGPPDVREQDTLLTREISRQAEAYRQMRNDGSGSAVFTTMPPPIALALARSPSPPPQPDRATSPSQSMMMTLTMFDTFYFSLLCM
ncbi:hypothetical protein PIB30_007054 [Stylosanthes scabra]|uniref:Uncharacterized protein n=1 Tax=Stylosanthes scabra TaxID=79078 RepID=A0ABU6Q4J2_9FABA|nr:hypothetical protein [Stylosanthes scabra]